MQSNTILMPANYAVVDEDEMTYIGGGADVLGTIDSIASSIVSGTVGFFRVIGESLVSCARSFVEITMDDLRNPNFWGAVAITGVLALIGFGAASVENKSNK